MISNERIEVTNQPAHIDEDIKDSLFEAFVTGGKSEAGHGLDSMWQSILQNFQASF